MSKSKPKKLATKLPKEEPKEVEEVKDVKNEFNCERCSGLGLVGDPSDINSKICAVCSGTGKV
jgi:hypothetical protein